VERPYDAVSFDLLSALLDSWTLWERVAGDRAAGRAWRLAYLKRAREAGGYVPFLALVAEAAADAGVPAAAAGELERAWDTLEPWPEAPAVLAVLAQARIPFAVVTNCSEELGQRAAQLVGAEPEVVVTAERVGCFKPCPDAYGLALAELGADAERTLSVACSEYDIAGAASVGHPVIWHNRLEQDATAEPGEPRPLAVVQRLDQLLPRLTGHTQGISP
jgi:2-haloacid dehalogenase